MPTHPITLAQPEDIPTWLELARQVEHLFGQRVDDSNFPQVLRMKIDQGLAFCVRVDDGQPGAPLAGGLLWSEKPPVYKIGWLAVSAKYRRLGVGRRLVEYVLERVQGPGVIEVITFGDDDPEGEPARKLYQRFGFQPAEAAPDGPDGSARRIYRLNIE